MLGLRINVHRPLAEIFIIVAGVLIALGFDSWNDNRIDRLLETQYLERLREDVSDNAEVFDRKVAYLEEVAELTVQPDDRFDLSSARNLLALSAVYGWAIPLYRTGTFEELKSTGNLGLIRDLNLRTALNEYDLSLRNLYQRTDAHKTDYPAYLHTLHPGISDRSAGTQLGSSNVPFEIDEDLRNRVRTDEFRHHLYAEINFANSAKTITSDFQSESEELLSLLDQALAE